MISTKPEMELHISQINFTVLINIIKLQNRNYLQFHPSSFQWWYVKIFITMKISMQKALIQSQLVVCRYCTNKNKLEFVVIFDRTTTFISLNNCFVSHTTLIMVWEILLDQFIAAHLVCIHLSFFDAESLCLW